MKYCTNCRHFIPAADHPNPRDKIEFGRCAKTESTSPNRFLSPDFNPLE